MYSVCHSPITHNLTLIDADDNAATCSNGQPVKYQNACRLTLSSLHVFRTSGYNDISTFRPSLISLIYCSLQIPLEEIKTVLNYLQL